ncbi:hypothetical protein A1Q2_06026 [Trichosporon asahii var. asahii CBS 8904]|uniref:Uncharacterized protein n=1 Tax=Trichosporon asahii var. asahii (strain CBS 8904) TaxID=1220162 RepID=K1VKI4_TRIAC|nr:hypothetical protein A1Q2_06026 [Trichosporon asahii var. asahii CBS 8904]
MSLASKAFFGFSMLFTGGTIWAVHYMQQQESEVSRQRFGTRSLASKGALDVPLELATLNHDDRSGAHRPSVRHRTERCLGRLDYHAALESGSSVWQASPRHFTHDTPIRKKLYIVRRQADTRQNMYQGVIKDEERLREKALKKVQQPAAVVDEDCVTCVVSPPPQLLEAQSKEQRAAERQARLEEYEAQKGLAQRLSRQAQAAQAPAQAVQAAQTEQRLV